MKKVMLCMVLLFTLNTIGKTIMIKGYYTDFQNNPFTLNWKVVKKNNVLKFFLKNKLKAEVYIARNGQIIKIVEYKTLAGREKKFIIDKKEYIKLELKTDFFPFSFARDYFVNGKVNTKKQNKFKLIEVKEK